MCAVYRVSSNSRWFLKSLPSRIGNLLDVTLKDLEKVLYCEAYVVLDPKETDLQRGQVLTEDEYQLLLDEKGYDSFVANMGGEAIRDILAGLDLLIGLRTSDAQRVLIQAGLEVGVASTAH